MDLTVNSLVFRCGQPVFTVYIRTRKSTVLKWIGIRRSIACQKTDIGVAGTRRE